MLFPSGVARRTPVGGCPTLDPRDEARRAIERAGRGGDRMGESLSGIALRGERDREIE